MTKSELRKIYLEKQKSLSSAERDAVSLQIADVFFDYFRLDKTRFLHTFLPIEKNCEINTFAVIYRLWRDFPEITISVSRVNFETMTIEILKFDSKTELVANHWHIPEPTGNELIEVEKIDAVLVPLLCYDGRGFRVGYGKGFYDKFLKNCRADCLKIGLSYFAPVNEISDAQEFDVKLDFCVTPQKVVEF
jgi:5-formyltetrahydrofolate cyclo-ligase